MENELICTKEREKRRGMEMLQGISLNSHVASVDNTSQDYENPSNPELRKSGLVIVQLRQNVFLHDKDVLNALRHHRGPDLPLRSKSVDLYPLPYI
jgi:hypothetical protein